MKIAYGIVHRKSTRQFMDVETDRNGRYELYKYPPKYSNKKDYKTVKVKMIVVKP